jgi:hypothetical protein
MILSNPDIEKEYDDGTSHYSLNTKTVRTDEFLSMRDLNDSVAENDNVNHLNQLKLFVRMQNQTTDVEFMFSNLRLIVTLPILERLSKFGEKIANLQKESEEAKMKAKILEVSKLLNKEDEDDSDSDGKGKSIEKLNVAKLALATKLSEIKQKKEKEEKGLIQRLREERERYLTQGKKITFKIIDENSKTNAKGRLKNFEIWIPLDSTNEY